MVVRVKRKELTSGEVLELLENGERVIVEIDLLGSTMEMAIREQRGTYYCDTPVKLLTYESKAAMRTCLERYRLAKPDDADAPTDGTSPSAE